MRVLDEQSASAPLELNSQSLTCTSGVAAKSPETDWQELYYKQLADDAQTSTTQDESDLPIVSFGDSQDGSLDMTPEECEFLTFDLQAEQKLSDDKSLDSLFDNCDLDLLKDFSGVSISGISFSGVDFSTDGKAKEV